MKVLGFQRSEIEKVNPHWPDYRHPYFDPMAYCRDLVQRYFPPASG